MQTRDSNSSELQLTISSAEVENLKAEVKNLKIENAELRSENAGLRSENAGLRSENDLLKRERSDLSDPVKQADAAAFRKLRGIS
jgi:FtsZ-binding cell division protein ZapB